MVPTNLKPLFFSALDRASEAGVDVGISLNVVAVSYTHLDVYKRQPYCSSPLFA